MKVEELLTRKPRRVLSVRPWETVAILVHKLRLAGIGAMVVSEDDETLAGIVSERDIVHGLAEHGARCLEMTVADLMTTRVITCARDAPVERIARLMTVNRIRHLPVVEGRRVVGLISIGDVVKSRLDEVELEASVLRDMAAAAH